MMKYQVQGEAAACTNGLARVDSLNRTSRKFKRVVFVFEVHYARSSP